MFLLFLLGGSCLLVKNPTTSITDYLSIYGAVLSTLLAIFKIYDIYQNRFRLEVSHSFTTSYEIGNSIGVYNASGKPVTITAYKLQFFDKQNVIGWKIAHTINVPDDEDLISIKINPYTQTTLNFRDQDHFDWGTQKICILFHIAGRNKSVSKTLYTPE